MGGRVPAGAAAACGLLLALALTACGAPGATGVPATGGQPVAAAAAPSAAAPRAEAASSPANVTPATVEIDGAEPAPVGLVDVAEDGSLNIPKDIDTLGWWVGSKPMGATKGTTLIAGHVDSAAAGLGYFAKLTDLTEGDPITVVDGLGEKWEFEVSSTKQVVKSALPKDLFDTTGERRLALITCGGEFDAAKRSYVDNYIVYATPVPSG
jgi:LPXTG-site transpeptidase (sortase) family protein